MAEFGWIKMSFLLMALLQVRAEKFLSFTVRDGDEVTLPCENVIDGQKNCVYTTWLFIGLRSSSSVELINLGQIGEGGKSKSDRLSVTAKCSLVIKKVTVQDVGRYTCRQFDKSGKQQGEDSDVHLSVINMTEQKDDDNVTLSCSVSTYDECRHRVKWLYEGKDVEKDNKDLQTSQPGCYTTVSFLTSHHIYTSRLNLFTCEVTDGHTNKVQLFPFSLQSSGEDSVRTTTKPTTTTSEKMKTGTTTTASAINNASTQLRETGRYILVVGLVAFMITIIAVVRLRRAKASKTQTDDKLELTSDPAEPRPAPEAARDTADPGDVSYASIRFTKPSDGDSQVWTKSGNDGEGEAATYSSVRAASSSADPGDLYATVNKPK